jgi:hypothetical protein
MSWAQRLRRVFNIDVNTCIHCGSSVRIVASIEEPTAIRAILDHFAKHAAMEEAHCRPAARAPPAVAARCPAGHVAGGETSTRPDAATIPQGCARPAVSNWRKRSFSSCWYLDRNYGRNF